MPILSITYTIRRCTGFMPSRTSGSARSTMTDIEYRRKLSSMTSSTVRISTVFEWLWSVCVSTSPSTGLCSCCCIALSSFILDIQFLKTHFLCICLNKVFAHLDLITHQFSKNRISTLRIFKPHLHQNTIFRVHCCFP